MLGYGLCVFIMQQIVTVMDYYTEDEITDVGVSCVFHMHTHGGRRFISSHPMAGVHGRT